MLTRIRVLVNLEFQFHKGTIRTDLLGTAIAALGRFQFHKGTIRTEGVIQLAKILPIFQFHKGTIRTEVSSRNKISFEEISIP